jgi:hypothetical protein
MYRRLKGNIREKFWREDWTVIEESKSMGLSFVNISAITSNNNNNNKNNLLINFKLMHYRVQNLPLHVPVQGRLNQFSFF